MDRCIWKTVKKCMFVPTHKVNGVVENIPKKDRTKNDKENVQCSLKEKAVITTTLGLGKFLSSFSLRLQS